MKDHAVRVGNEAEFILNRARADDVKRQADAEMQHAQLIGATKREESACATLISAARRRDALQGSATARRALQALTNPSGCWHRAETDKGGVLKWDSIKKLCYWQASSPVSLSQNKKDCVWSYSIPGSLNKFLFVPPIKSIGDWMRGRMIRVGVVEWLKILGVLIMPKL